MRVLARPYCAGSSGQPYSPPRTTGHAIPSRKWWKPIIVEKHQLAGLDDQERGFSRLVELEQADGRFQASLQYEKTRVVTGRCETAQVALTELIQMLQSQGYTQLRAQVNFRGDSYLGTQEPWADLRHLGSFVRVT